MWYDVRFVPVALRADHAGDEQERLKLSPHQRQLQFTWNLKNFMNNFWLCWSYTERTRSWRSKAFTSTSDLTDGFRWLRLSERKQRSNSHLIHNDNSSLSRILFRDVATSTNIRFMQTATRRILEASAPIHVRTSESGFNHRKISERWTESYMRKYSVFLYDTRPRRIV